jgi:DNA-binding CsgD family transcriptional regulator
LTEAQEAEFDTWASEAKLTLDERHVAEMWIDGAPYNKIARALSLQRTVVFKLVRSAGQKLSRVAPDYWQPGREFPKQVVECVRNRRIEDETGLSGVAPDHSVRDRLPAARVITGYHPALRQSQEDCLRHWGRALAGV